MPTTSFISYCLEQCYTGIKQKKHSNAAAETDRGSVSTDALSNSLLSTGNQLNVANVTKGEFGSNKEVDNASDGTVL